MNTMKKLLEDDKLIVAGLNLINETSIMQFPSRLPLFEQVYRVAKKYQDSRYMPCFHAADFIKAYKTMSNRHNNRDGIIDLND